MQKYSSITKQARKEVLRIEKKCKFEIKEREEKENEQHVREKIRKMSCFNSKVSVVKLHKGRSMYKNRLSLQRAKSPTNSNSNQMQHFLKNLEQGKNDLNTTWVRKQMIKFIFNHNHTPYTKDIQDMMEKKTPPPESISSQPIVAKITNNFLQTKTSNFAIVQTIGLSYKVSNQLITHLNDQIKILNEEVQLKWKEKLDLQSQTAVLANVVQQQRKDSQQMSLKIEMLQYELLKYTKIKERLLNYNQPECYLAKAANKFRLQQQKIYQYSKAAQFTNISSQINYFNTLHRQLRFSLNNIWQQLQREDKESGRHKQIRTLIDNFATAIQPIIKTLSEANTQKQQFIRVFEEDMRGYQMMSGEKKDICLRVKKEYALMQGRLECMLEEGAALDNTNTNQSPFKSQQGVRKYLRNLQSKFTKLALFC